MDGPLRGRVADGRSKSTQSEARRHELIGNRREHDREIGAAQIAAGIADDHERDGKKLPSREAG